MTESNKEFIVVTGGSRGIGRAIVDRVQAGGRGVVNLDIRPPEAAAASNDERFLETDLSDPAAIDDAFCAIDEFGSVVGLVNNAGAVISHSLAETTEEDFARLVAVNVTGAALAAKHAAERMKAAGWGRIVNISSRTMVGKTNRTAYAATKGAIASMTKVWALELAPYGITVNAVAPGPIATDLYKEGNPPGSPQSAALIASIPVGRIGEPDDIGRAVSFFLDKGNSFVTGQILFVCGGLTVGNAGA
jgi:3-oxoacyl-[acyl-carrier protein] reductase